MRLPLTLSRRLVVVPFPACVRCWARATASFNAAADATAPAAQAAFKAFGPELDDIKNLIRNAERLCPEDIGSADTRKMRLTYDALKRQNTKKKLAAELELKMRRIYFDRIKPEAVEGVVKSIYEEITSLDDIVFLIKNARAIFPASPADVNGKDLKAALVDLQAQLAAERAAAIAGLVQALKGLYSHVEPPLIVALAEDVAALFSKADDLKKLAADVADLFPAEPEAVVPKRIRAAFVRAADAS